MEHCLCGVVHPIYLHHILKSLQAGCSNKFLFSDFRSQECEFDRVSRKVQGHYTFFDGIVIDCPKSLITIHTHKTRERTDGSVSELLSSTTVY